ncbi:MAG: hypothetical protein PUB05_03005 [Firmicutes bacterium]|nr:hypothetical protein [Bacillota bacterium]
MSNRYYVDSLAYDFDMFMPKENKQNNVVELPRQAKTSSKARPSARPRAALSPVKIMVILAMVAAVAFTIYLRGEINSVSSQIAKMEKQIDQAQSENVSLEMQLENCVSYKNLEQSAAALGMHRADKSQITYIVVNDTDVTQKANSDGTYTAANNE